MDCHGFSYNTCNSSLKAARCRGTQDLPKNPDSETYYVGAFSNIRKLSKMDLIIGRKGENGTRGYVNSTAQTSWKGTPGCCRRILRGFIFYLLFWEIVAMAMAKGARVPVRFPYYSWGSLSRLSSCTSFQSNHRMELSFPDFSASTSGIFGCTYHSDSYTYDVGRSKERALHTLWCNIPLRLFKRDGQVHLCLANGTMHFSTLHRCNQNFANPNQKSIKHMRAVSMSGSVELSTFAPGNPVSIDDVLQYWFKDVDIANKKFFRAIWFSGGEAVDKEIKENFGHSLELASKGELDHWKSTPRGRVALVILLDQFSRNIYRETPRSFAQDEAALNISLDTINKGLDKQLNSLERYFLYMPLMHSESLEVHEKAYSLFQSNADSQIDDPQFYEFLQRTVKFESAHNTVLTKYGRYPSRNVILGRKSTPEEEEYLASGVLWPMSE